MDVKAGTFGGFGVGGRFVEGWTAKELDSALPIECCAAYLSIHFVSNIVTHPAASVAVLL
jgi:hypothetical protein